MFSADDISCFITALCTGWLRDSFFGFISSFFFMCVSVFLCLFFCLYLFSFYLYFVYDFHNKYINPFQLDIVPKIATLVYNLVIRRQAG